MYSDGTHTKKTAGLLIKFTPWATLNHFMLSDAAVTDRPMCNKTTRLTTRPIKNRPNSATTEPTNKSDLQQAGAGGIIENVITKIVAAYRF